MFVTNWNSTTKIQKISEITNFFRHYFLSRTEVISISESLRSMTIQCARQMHEVFKSGILPKANKQHHCKNCSLVNLCIPEMSDCTLVSTYLNKNLYEDIT